MELTICCSGFDTIREEEFLYVDKTETIFRMIENHRMCFIARPHLFGRGLLHSTIESLFSRGTEMFKGLAIEKLWKDRTYKVLRFGFGGISCTTAENFRKSALEALWASTSGEFIDESSSPEDFPNIAALMHEIVRRTEPESIVLLISGYDRSLNKCLDKPELFREISSSINDFFSEIEKGSSMFRFVLVTGVSRFRDQVLGSGHLIDDISLDPEYAALLGFTEEEIRKYFGAHLRDAAASVFNVSTDSVTESQVDLIMDSLRRYYGGFCFDREGKVRVYQPWSVMHFLMPGWRYSFSDYWFRQCDISPLPETETLLIEESLMGKEERLSADWKDSTVSLDPGSVPSALSFLTQFGFFSIKSTDEQGFSAGLTNLEMRMDWARILVSGIMKDLDNDRVTAVTRSENALSRPDAGAQDISSHFSDILNVLKHGRIETAEEACRLLILYCTGSGFDMRPYRDGNGSCSGLICEFPDRLMKIALRLAREGETPEKKLDEAKEQLLKDKERSGSGDRLRKLRRIAMVFSVPEQSIVLSEDV